MKKRVAYILTIAVVVFGMLATSCSTKKNTAMSRNYQAFITRYNVYYNGNEHFNTTLKEMEKKYEDDYSRRLYMHPAEAYADQKAPKPSGSFDRSIEKAQKAIQLHSIKKKPAKKSGKGQDADYKAWMKREEYNPFLHNAWMLMGRSQYFKGDFAGAATTFAYINKHFTWLPDVTTAAKIWEARSYCAMDWLFEAETILRRIKPDEDLTDKSLREQYYFTYADYYIRSNKYEEAIPMLTEAIKYAGSQQKIRLNFLLGQLYAAEGRKAEAYKAFKAAGGASGASYRTQFNARIKQSEVYEGENIEPEVKALRRMTRYDRNKQYLDQIYYAIGNLYLSRRDTTEAIDNYKLAIEKSTRSGIDKALVQLTLGQLYFDRHEYDLAQPCYSEAVPALPDNYPDYALLKRRSDVLDELAVYAQNVTLQDSLLRLSAMSPEEQLAVVNKIIDDLKKKEKEEADEARREEFLAQQGAQGSQLNNNNTPSTFTMNGEDSWYFYNTATRNAGKTEFQRRWGSRKLEDDWRRRNKATFNANDFETAESDGSEEEKTTEGEGDEGIEEKEKMANNANDPHFPEYYLKQIPKTDEERANSNEIIQEGLYNMGLILKDKLEDYSAATEEWNTLMRRYPDNVYRLDVYYNMYLMYMREHKTLEAQRYRDMILTEFADSKEGMALRDPDFLEHLKEMDTKQEVLYESTLDDYLNNRNKAVHQSYEYMEATYPMSKIMPKFMFLHALAFVTENNTEKFNSTLKELLERYPTTDISPLASAYLKGMAQGRQLHAPENGNMRGMIWDIHLSNDSTATGGANGEPLTLDLDPNAPQMLVLIYPTDSVATNTLLYDIARHNFTTFVVRDFDLELMNFGRLGLLIIKGFNNQAEANHYRQLLEGDTAIQLPSSVRPVIIGVKDFETLLSQGRSFEEYFRLVGEKTMQETHESVLPPEEYPAAEEMYPTEETEEDAEPAPEVKPEVKEEPKPEPKPEVKPEPEMKEEPKPEVKEEPKPEPKPEVKPGPEVKPEQPKQQEQPKQPEKSKKEPTTPAPTTPKLPEYPIGAEDDPLLE